MDAKDNRKRADDQIKILAVYKSDMADSDSDASTRVPHKKKEITGVIPAWKQKDMKTPKHKGYQCYYVIYTTTGITDIKYKLNSSEISLDTGPTRNTSRKAWEGDQATGTLPSNSDRSLLMSGRGSLNTPRNKEKYSLA